MRITLGPFKGEIPRADRDKLPPGYGQVAVNAKLWSGGLRAFRAPRRVAELEKTGVKRSLYRWGAVPGGDAEGEITAVAGGDPVAITSPGHGLTTGARVFVSGTGVASIDDKTHVVTVTGANAFTLDGTDDEEAESEAGYWVKQNGFWFHWLEDVDVSRGTVAGDTLERTYFTGDGAPKMTYAGIATTGGAPYPAASYTLGVPAPETAIDVALGSGGGCDAADQITTRYVYTYVTEVGEEGPPSPLSALVTYCPGQARNLSGMATGPDGPYNVTHKRIYRVPFGVEALQFVAEVAVAQTTYEDTAGDDELAEMIPSADPFWSAPPAGMHSIGFLANGIGYGAVGNDAYFTPAFMPHAWPEAYRLTTDSPIVGIGAFDTSVVLCTAGVPYLVTGSDPAGMAMTKFADFPQSCVSKRGIVGLEGFGVVYPSPDGLVAVGPGGPSLVTRAYLTPDEWRAMNPESIVAFAHDGRYFGFSGSEGFIFDPQDAGAGFVRLDQSCTGGFKDLLTDSLYLIEDGFVVKWEGAAERMAYRWRSPLVRTPRPVNFGFGQVFAESYSDLTLRVYGDGTLRHTQTVTSSRPFRLPDGYLAELWEVEIEGKDDVREIRIASGAKDLRDP